MVFNLIGQGLVLALSFIAVRLIFRQLGGDVFGIIYFNITLAALLTTVLELGISATTVREVAQFFDTEPGYVTRLIQTFSLVYWVFGGVILVAVFFGAPVLVRYWINLTTIDPDTAANIIRILSIGTMVALPRALYTSLFRGRQRMAINNAIDVTIAATQQIGIVVILKLGFGVFAVAGWMSAVMLVGMIAYLVVAARMFGTPSLVPRFDRTVVARNLRFTSLMAGGSLLALVHSSVDRVVVSKLLPITQFGFYGFASATVGRALFVSGAIIQAAYPSFSSLSRTDRPALQVQYRKVQDLVAYVVAPMFAAIVFAGLPLYTYTFNAGVARSLLLPTTFLCIGFALNAASSPAYTLTIAMGRPEIFVRANTVALFITVPVAVLLTVAFGIAGAAFSFVFYNLFIYIYAIPVTCRECLDFSPWKWYLETAKPFGLAALLYGLAWLAIAPFGSYSLPALVIAYAAASAMYAGGAFLLVGEELRYTLTSVQRWARSRFAASAPAVEHAPTVPGGWPWGRTAIVGAASIALGAVLGALSYAHVSAGAVWMVAAVVLTGVVFVMALGTTLGAMLLLIVTCFIDQWIFGVRGLNLRPEQVAVVLVALVFVIQRLRAGRGLSARPNFAEAALLAWFAVGLLSSVLDAPDRSQSLKVLTLLVLSSGALFLPRRVLDADGAQIDQVIGWTLLCFAGEAAYATLAYFVHLLGPSVSIGLNPATGHLDAFGSLWEPNVLGAISAAGALAWIYLGPRYFKLPWIGVALCVTASVASFTRAAWLAGAVVMLLTLATPIRRRLDLRAFGLGCLAATVLTIGIFAADSIGNYTVSGNIGTSVGNATDIIGRLRQIGPVLADLKGKLLIIGGGTNSFGERHVLAGFPEHLGTLELMVLNDTGLIGVILFAAFAISIIIAAWRARSDIRVLGLSAMMLVLALTNTSTETLELMITWLLVGLLLATVDSARTRQPASDASQRSRYRLVTSSQL